MDLSRASYPSRPPVERDSRPRERVEDLIDRCGIDLRELSGYQRLVLPGGQVVPGVDRSDVADRVFPADLTGRSVLDVGCYYGYFLHEAARRGARRAVGVEPDG